MIAKEHDEKALLKKISELEAELRKVKKQKKYGLVWEDKPEQIVEDCKRNVSILRLKEKKKGIDPVIATDKSKDENILIEGDNYHALSVLNYTHKGKIDVIYIDPPYNTGSDGFRYCDSRLSKEFPDGTLVPKDHPYRHSYWISFIEKRLNLAKTLLSKDGVIFISIDDNELPQLRLICDGIFGETNFIGNFIWKKKRKGSHLSKTFRSMTEYVLCYAKNIFDVELYGEQAYSEKMQPLAKRTNSNKVLFFKKEIVNTTLKDGIYKKGKYGKGTSSIIFDNDIVVSSGKITCDFSATGPFVWQQSMLDKELQLGTQIFLSSKFGFNVLRGNQEEKSKTPSSILDSSIGVGTNEDASEQLIDIFSKEGVMDYPKPASLIKYLIRTKTFNLKKATVLDFFAGSGTTGQSVLELNNEDGGDRKFILCTNNENNICEEVTYERVKRVMTGYKNNKGEKVEGLGGNLRYYKTDLVDIEKLHHTPDQAKVKLTYQAGEMVGLRENTLNEVAKNDWWQIFEGHGKTTAIYFKEDKEKLQDLVDLLEKKKQSAVLYIFSWGKNEYKGEYSSANIRVEDIPEPILEVYKEINRL